MGKKEWHANIITNISLIILKLEHHLNADVSDSNEHFRYGSDTFMCILEMDIESLWIAYY